MFCRILCCFVAKSWFTQFCRDICFVAIYALLRGEKFSRARKITNTHKHKNLQNMLFSDLRCFVPKSILSRFTRFCVEKNCDRGEKMTNMRYGWWWWWRWGGMGGADWSWVVLIDAGNTIEVTSVINLTHLPERTLANIREHSENM